MFYIVNIAIYCMICLIKYEVKYCNNDNVRTNSLKKGKKNI